MSKKHFQKLAYELMCVRPDRQHDEYETWRNCIHAVAKACAQSNGMFDHQRFIDACQADDYKPAMHGR